MPEFGKKRTGLTRRQRYVFVYCTMSMFYISPGLGDGQVFCDACKLSDISFTMYYVFQVLCFKELAVNTPTFFFQQIQQFFECIFTAVRDQKVS